MLCNVSYGFPETHKSVFPGLRLPNRAEPIAWVPLTKWGLTIALSALNILAYTLSKESLPISSYPYPDELVKWESLILSSWKAFNTFIWLNSLISS